MTRHRDAGPGRLAQAAPSAVAEQLDDFEHLQRGRVPAVGRALHPIRRLDSRDPQARLHPRTRESAPQRHPPHLHVLLGSLSTVFKISRVVYYLDDPRLKQQYFIDAWVALSKRKPVFYTHGFVEVNIMIEAVIFVLHEALNFSDSPSAIVARSQRRSAPSARRRKRTASPQAWSSKKDTSSERRRNGGRPSSQQ